MTTTMLAGAETHEGALPPGPSAPRAWQTPPGPLVRGPFLLRTPGALRRRVHDSSRGGRRSSSSPIPRTSSGVHRRSAAAAGRRGQRILRPDPRPALGAAARRAPSTWPIASSCCRRFTASACSATGRHGEAARAEIARWPRRRAAALWPSMQAITLEVILRAVFGYASAGAVASSSAAAAGDGRPDANPNRATWPRAGAASAPTA